MDKYPNPNFEGAIRNPDDLIPGEIYCRHHTHLTDGNYLVKVISKELVKLDWEDNLVTKITFTYLDRHVWSTVGYATDWGVEPYNSGWHNHNYTTHVPVPAGRGRKVRLRHSR